MTSLSHNITAPDKVQMSLDALFPIKHFHFFNFVLVINQNKNVGDGYILSELIEHTHPPFFFHRTLNYPLFISSILRRGGVFSASTENISTPLTRLALVPVRFRGRKMRSRGF